MTQCTGVASYGDGVSAGLRALLLAVATTAPIPTPPQEGSSSATRNNPSREAGNMTPLD